MTGKHLNFVETQTAKVLKAAGNTDHAIGVELNRSPHTIKKHMETPTAIVEISAFKLDLASMFENLADRLLNSISDQDILKLNAFQRTVSSGIATDKMRLLRRESHDDGQPSNLELLVQAMRVADKLSKQIEAEKVATSDAGQMQLESGKGKSQPSDPVPEAEDVEKP